LEIAMGRKAKLDLDPACCNGAIKLNDDAGKVEAVISIDERGQMVLPKELRDRVGIKAGDKLVVISRKNEGDVCCITLIKTDYFMSILGEKLGPMVGELTLKK